MRLAYNYKGVFSILGYLGGSSGSVLSFLEKRGEFVGRGATYLKLFSTITVVLKCIRSLIPIFTKVPKVGLKLTGLKMLFVLGGCSFERTTLISIIHVLIVKFVFKGLFDVLCDLTKTTLDVAIVALVLGGASFDLVNIDITKNISRGVNRLVVTVLVMRGTDIFMCTPTLLITNITTKMMVNKLAGRVLGEIRLWLWGRRLSRFVVFRVASTFFGLLLCIPIPN